MADKPNAAAAAILAEAAGAHRTSREILDLILEPASDPIEKILAALAAIQTTQQTILTRLAVIERRLASHN